MKIYISLPISNIPNHVARDNADRIQHALSRKGHEVVNPFNIVPPNPKPKYEDYICADLREMMNCDAIYFAPGWGVSIGCNIEYDVAKWINKKREAEGRKKIRLYLGDPVTPGEMIRMSK